jgi:glycosyltransferase involved in cell wall biosynthesis
MKNQISKNNPDISVIVPVFCNEGELHAFFDEILTTVIQKNSEKLFELVFIDDGSKDNSLKELLEIKSNFPEMIIKIIKFTRNFGQVSALYAGYQVAQGECIINISADLQDPPRLINTMIEAYFNEGFPIVVFYRESREDDIGSKITSSFFYNLIRKLSFSNMPSGGFDFVLLSKPVRDIIIKIDEANPFWQGQILWTGYPVKFLPYSRRKRKIGKSKWSLAKKITYMIDGVTSYSNTPMRFMTYIGALIALFGFIYGFILLIIYFFGNTPFKGWTPIMMLILFFSGIQILMIGIIGEYLWRTLDQVRKRDRYIIEKIY